jgi:hypothetical protein
MRYYIDKFIAQISVLLNDQSDVVRIGDVPFSDLSVFAHRDDPFVVLRKRHVIYPVRMALNKFN